MDTKCAPSKEYNEGSCFTLEDLIDLSKSYNKINQNNKIRIKENKKYLLKELTSRMRENYKCMDQVCWVKTNIIKNLNNKNLINNTFRPNGPKKENQWLSTTDINKVMKQYEDKYKDFKFLGAVPYDFEDLPYLETYKFDISKLNNKNRFGMVINLDEHYKAGSHWVSLFADVNKKQIYYFDSVGIKPGKRVARFVKGIYSRMLEEGYNDNDLDIRFNKKQHQFKNTECGVYSMNFIIRLLNGEKFDKIVNNITKDDKMRLCRKSYFRNNN